MRPERDRTSSYIRLISDPYAGFPSLQKLVAASNNGAFVLCTAGTRTSDCDGISAAGASSAARRLTPAVDAEALLTGRVYSASELPVSPDGIVSPVVISRALVKKLDLNSLVIDAGCFVTPKVECLRFGNEPANCLSSGAAIPRALVQLLFDQGVELGKKLAKEREFLVLAECVPGGTSTALAVLMALGFAAEGMTSSSLPQSNHGAKIALVAQGLSKSGFSTKQILEDPLKAISAVGDPVQATLCGVAYGASPHIPVLMGGGSQMLAIWAVLRACFAKEKESFRADSIFVLSTKWVGFDRSAAVGKLAELLNAPFAVACPEFGQSRHQGLRAYEDGHVKEGAGAGASLCLAFMNELDHDEIIKTIDDEYDVLVGPALLTNLSTVPSVSISINT